MAVGVTRAFTGAELAAIAEYSEEFLDASRYGELDDLKLMWNHDRLRELIDFKNLSEAESGTSPLMLACANGHMDCVKFLVEGVLVDVNHTNMAGNTALHWSALNGHTECVEYLIRNSANVLSENNFRHTPFDEAIARDKKECCEILVQEEVRLAQADGDVDMAYLSPAISTQLDQVTEE